MANGSVVLEVNDTFIYLLNDGTYRIGITGLSAIAKPKDAEWQQKVKTVTTMIGSDDEIEDSIYVLMK